MESARTHPETCSRKVSGHLTPRALGALAMTTTDFTVSPPRSGECSAALPPSPLRIPGSWSSFRPLSTRALLTGRPASWSWVSVSGDLGEIGAPDEHDTTEQPVWVWVRDLTGRDRCLIMGTVRKIVAAFRGRPSGAAMSAYLATLDHPESKGTDDAPTAPLTVLVAAIGGDTDLNDLNRERLSTAFRQCWADAKPATWNAAPWRGRFATWLLPRAGLDTGRQGPDGRYQADQEDSPRPYPRAYPRGG